MIDFTYDWFLMTSLMTLYRHAWLHKKEKGNWWRHNIMNIPISHFVSLYYCCCFIAAFHLHFLWLLRVCIFLVNEKIHKRRHNDKSWRNDDAYIPQKVACQIELFKAVKWPQLRQRLADDQREVANREWAEHQHDGPGNTFCARQVSAPLWLHAAVLSVLSHRWLRQQGVLGAFHGRRSFGVLQLQASYFVIFIIFIHGGDVQCPEHDQCHD